MSAFGFILQFAITVVGGTWLMLNFNWATTPLGVIVLALAYYWFAAMVGQIPRSYLEHRQDPDRLPRGFVRMLRERKVYGGGQKDPWQKYQ